MQYKDTKKKPCEIMENIQATIPTKEKNDNINSMQFDRAKIVVRLEMNVFLAAFK